MLEFVAFELIKPPAFPFLVRTRALAVAVVVVVAVFVMKRLKKKD